MQPPTQPSSPGVYAALPELLRLQHQAHGYTLLPRQPAHSILSGQHASKLRGRGLDFSELKPYQPGDDTRTIDWKATSRSQFQKPYARAFNEERQRPALLVVDQRQNMFFGSRLNFKSVTAAHIAAAALWRVLKQKDAIGAIVFSDNDIRCIRPQRSNDTAMQILRAIVDLNNKLSWNSGQAPDPAALNQALAKAAQLATHDYLVLQITDGFGISDETRKLNNAIAQHNDLIFTYIYDPLELDLPTAPGLTITDGIRQMNIDATSAQREKFKSDHQQLAEQIKRFWSGRQIPVLPISAAEPPLPQIRKLLTHGSRK